MEQMRNGEMVQCSVSVKVGGDPFNVVGGDRTTLWASCVSLLQLLIFPSLTHIYSTHKSIVEFSSQV